MSPSTTSYGSCSSNESSKKECINLPLLLSSNSDDERDDEEGRGGLRRLKQEEEKPSFDRMKHFYVMVIAVFSVLTFVSTSYLVVIALEIHGEVVRNDGTSFSASREKAAKDQWHHLSSPSSSSSSSSPIGQVMRDTSLLHDPLTKSSDVTPDIPSKVVKVLIVYGPEDDIGQRRMADEVIKGVKSIDDDENIKIVIILRSISTATFDQVVEADAVIIGAPVENANVHHKVQQWINENWIMSPEYDLSNTVGGAFVTAGGISAGEEGAVSRLLHSMLIFQMIVVGGNSWTSAFGASAVTYEAPFSAMPEDHFDKENNFVFNFPDGCYAPKGEVIHPVFLSKAFGLGFRVATVAKKISTSKRQ